MTAKETVKELYDKVKAIFDGSPAPAAAPAAVTAPAPTVYTLADGTQIAIAQAGATPAIGDTVTIAGVPAPEGTLTLTDGSSITVDATGTITACTPVTPAAAAPAMAAPVAAPAPVLPVTQSAMSEIVQKFAVGDPEQRLTNLEIVCKALMESEFGYQISANERIESANAAIAVYQTTLQTQTEQLEAANQKIEKYGKVIEGMFELVGKLTELPTAEPKTLTGNKKDKFENSNKKEEKLNKIAEAMKEIRKNK